ncbi:nuclear autoantigenic sperm protein isoform X1 [Mus musculus]|uniref:Nuclear autoantigenic sperm protein n=1 Tax=Mus musculus TaxID=10090 RepID=B1AU75_MOUSE|nr:nuclear autoantigenic sperm protein isoform 2 [Mus musculus]XP_030109516.1 nuclear autoantigenic sperm protein isoform X1 [Mus musculus]EDL30598.1 nuclear autoantigenic sperm protein (histone-binding), isoform CRA_c [Mus musculus]|eukprot:NP_058057.3 nuclear autoantigenic sperm protein isoform 2 [Mus musculus]
MATESTAAAAIAAELVSADKIEDAPAPSTSADKMESLDVDSEAKKLLGLGQKHLVMGDIPAAVNAFQEAASLLGKKYGETANECGEAFFFYGKSLLELARMENGVLGNALEGVHVEEEEGEKTEDESLVENNDNVDEEAREELREQVYDAMGEKEAKKAEGKSLTKPETDKEQESEVEKGGREDMDISEPEEKLQETVEPTSKQLTESSEEAKEAAIPGLNEDEVASGKTEQESLCTEKGKSISGAYVQNKEFRETVEEGEEIISLEKKPKETSEDQPIRAAEKQGTLMKVVEIEAEIDPQVKSADVGGEEPKDQVATSESELGKAVLMELSGQDVEASPVVAAEAGAEVSEKPGQEITVIPNNGPVVGQSTVGDQTPSEPQTSAERLTETKDGSSVEEVKAELVPEQEEAMLPVEESEAAGDGVETKVAQRATEKAPEDKFKIAANEETQERDEQMKEGEETEGSEEEDRENDKAEETPNESVLEKKSLQENEEEEIGNLELAWDMLDLAKIIFKRQETKEAQLYAAQAHLKLGEVSVESENYIQAVEEFQACLSLQEQYLEAHDRLLAETHYQLGLAYGYNSQYDEAVAQFGKSIDVIEKRMAVLHEQMKEAEGSFTEYEKEIEELKELLPEIREKIEDAKESQRSGNVAELALKATLVESSTSGFTPSGAGASVSMIASRKPTDGASSSNCVTDISHLVRKKRKPEEESPRKDDAKKAKQEPEVNGGSGDAVSSGKEVSENMEAEAENQAESQTAEGTVESAATIKSTAC